MDYPRIQYEIESCHQEISRLQDRIRSLRALTSHPVVLPVLHWTEYRESMEDVYSDYPDQSGDLLREAYGCVLAMSENGQAWGTGVSVGGVFLSCDELAEIYADVGC